MFSQADLLPKPSKVLPISDETIDVTLYSPAADTDTDDEDMEDAEKFFGMLHRRFKRLEQAFEKSFEFSLQPKIVSTRFFDQNFKIQNYQADEKTDLSNNNKLQAAVTKTQNAIKFSYEKIKHKVTNDTEFLECCQHAKNVSQYMRAMSNQIKKLAKSKVLIEEDDFLNYTTAVIFAKDTLSLLELTHAQVKEYLKTKEDKLSSSPNP